MIICNNAHHKLQLMSVFKHLIKFDSKLADS